MVLPHRIEKHFMLPTFEGVNRRGLHKVHARVENHKENREERGTATQNVVQRTKIKLLVPEAGREIGGEPAPDAQHEADDD